jgi:hypothetical protein
MKTRPQVWLDEEVVSDSEGRLELRRTCAGRSVVVRFEPDVTDRWQPIVRPAEIIALFDEIQDAASVAYRQGRFMPVTDSVSGMMPHDLVVLAVKDIGG